MLDQKQEQNYKRYLGIDFVLLPKNFSGGTANGQKNGGVVGGGNFLLASRFFCFVFCPPPLSGGGRLFFSQIFDKISSSVVVNILI